MTIRTGKPKQVTGKVLGARYVPQIRCIMVTLRELKTGKTLKPIAIYEENFKFKPDHDIDKEMGELTELLKKMKHPITISHEEGQNEQDMFNILQ
jgi:hypothetical protein